VAGARSPGVDQVLGLVSDVAEVAAVSQQGAGLGFGAVAARVHHRGPRYLGGHSWAVLDRDEVQCQIDTAGDAGRRDDRLSVTYSTSRTSVAFG
jgi:hypothetical protein